MNGNPNTLDLRGLADEQRDTAVSLLAGRVILNFKPHEGNPFATNASLVIPLIERCGWVLTECFYDEDDKDWTMELFGSKPVTAPTFALAACLMLLQERGWGVLR